MPPCLLSINLSPTKNHAMITYLHITMMTRKLDPIRKALSTHSSGVFDSINILPTFYMCQVEKPFDLISLVYHKPKSQKLYSR